MSNEQGKRYNANKTRFDLIPAYAHEQVARVFTYGTEKYDDDNWRRGMPWRSVLASLKRHLNAFEMGEDFDDESGELHMAHVLCNAYFLTEYHRTHPEFDDRIKYSP